MIKETKSPMSKEGLDKLKRHVLGIKGLISQPELRQLVEKTGITGQRYLDEHNTQSNFLGGRYKDKPYSTTNLPAFFFGGVRFIERSKNIRINAPRFNLSNVLIRSEDVFWRTNAEGKRTAYIKGGYATWLTYTRKGKDLNNPDHTFTGAMLRNLTHSTIIKTDGAEIRWYVRPPHDDKAYYTHIKRNWLGFFEKEIEEIARLASQTYSVEVSKRISPD